MIFAATKKDVIILIRKTNELLPEISSVKITDGALSVNPKQEEYCACECGKRSQAVPIILGGLEAPEGAWPWNTGNREKLSIYLIKLRKMFPT